MARWGLRWIFCWISVLVTACTQVGSPPPPTEKERTQPSINAYSSLIPTASPILSTDIATITASATRLVNNENNGLEIGSPSCFSTPAASLICLGWVENGHELSLSNVLLEVVIGQRGGRVLARQIVSPALDPLLPGFPIPYRALFQLENDGAIEAETHLLNPDETLMVTTTAIALPLELTNIEWEGLDYRVLGQLQNPNDLQLSNIQLLLIVEKDQLLTGFRVIRLDGVIVPNGRYAIDLRIAPLNRVEGDQVRAYAFAYPD